MFSTVLFNVTLVPIITNWYQCYNLKYITERCYNLKYILSELDDDELD